MKVLTVVGARPQFIKAAAVSRVMMNTDGVNEVIVHTGQHYDEKMSDIFFSELSIPKPGYNLEIGSGSHGRQTGQMLIALEQVFMDEKPDVVLVYGDTNSTVAAALAASKLHISLAHVEAGLRSFDQKMPEEINRVVTDHISDLLFTPSDAADQNLKREGIDPKKIIQVGDVMYDASLYYAEHAEKHQDTLAKLRLDHKSYVLATIHRQENTDSRSRMEHIVAAFCEIAHQGMQIVFPVHPRTTKMLASFGLLERLQSSIRMIDPVGYLEMLQLEKQARLIVTDSGGVQKEAYFHRVPCLTLRDSTEWVELVEFGWNRLANPNDSESILKGYAAMMGASFAPKRDVQLYGAGQASERILSCIMHM